MNEQRKEINQAEDFSAREYIGGFDPHFGVFQELMAFKVREILLVSSPYDAYIMEEDGSLAARIINEYHGLNLSRPPRITRVATVEQALGLLDRKDFDLVITMPHLGEMDYNEFGARIKEKHPELPVILLAHSVQDAVADPHEIRNIDNTYIWCCDSDILLAIVKNVEDMRNVDFDTQRAMVRVILVVEDSALHRSRILPILYSELVRQTQAVLDEGLNEQHRLLKMRARPKILTAETYEKGMDLFTRYREDIFAVLSDVRLPRNGRMSDDAGFLLMQSMRRAIPGLPILMMSSEQGNRSKAGKIQAAFADKNAASLQDDIHAFLSCLGFGDFVFHLPDETEVGRAANMYEFERMLQTVPDESLMYHARNNHFSNWAMARAEVALASRLHKDRFAEIEDPDTLREDLVFKVHALRKLRQRGVVARFTRDGYDPGIMDFVKIGSGSMGGKARGIAFIGVQLQQSCRRESILAEVAVAVPQTCVITTQGFDDFIAHNNFHYQEGLSDREIGDMFVKGAMPSWLREDLRAYLEKIDYPLSVRSSSLLEDVRFRPYAGLYRTYMLANSHPDFEVRYSELMQAVKLVFASTWYEGPRAFSRSIGFSGADSMAVIVQQLAGSAYGEYFYPAISGVAQSYNFYPVSPMQPGNGIALIALGFGKTVVEGEQSLRFSPRFPEYLPQFSTADEILKNSQHRFYSLVRSAAAVFSCENSNLVRREIQDAVQEYPVSLLCSTYFPEEHRIRDADLPGSKVLTFAPVLKYGFYPLSEVLTELLALGREGLGCEVEIEFAVDLHDDPAVNIFYFLQIRPVVTGGESRDVRITENDRLAALLYSDKALGHGLYSSMYDILYVKPESFDRKATRDIAREIGYFNRILHRENRRFLLIGPGRWGTADPWMGIPVRWEDISGVGAMVELHGCGVPAEPSQGTHFFQNITSLGIPYLMIEDAGCEVDEGGKNAGGINRQWLNSREPLQELKFVCHIRLNSPFILKVDGQAAEAAGFCEDGEK
ncbi:MAG: PEP/pyruvate-binding domain-containing protein [Desulfobulbaceae bacterium]|nr:PEP/pyruvate-binding domain-containing protein [Desulfobulbaceae bacterium]